MIEILVAKRLLQCSKIIIEDDKTCRGFRLLKSFILHRLKSGIKVHLLLFEQSVNFMLEGLEGYSNFIIHNMALKYLNNDSELKKEVETLSVEPHVLIVDSLSRVAVSRSDPLAYYFFQRESPTCEATISIVHHTIEPKSFVDSLEKLAHATIRLKSENSSALSYKADLNIKVKGKKRTLFAEEIFISDTYEIKLLHSETIKLKQESTEQGDWYVSEALDSTQQPTEIQYYFDKGDDFDEDEAFDDFGEEEQMQSTFEIHIKEDEMEAKKQLVLPYTREAQEIARQKQLEEQSDDESSDEDPDADLDI